MIEKQRIEIFSEDREEVKIAIVRGMQEFAEKSEIWYKEGYGLTNILFINGHVLAFKPGISDSLLFRKLVDQVIDSIMSPTNKHEKREYTNQSIVGASVMGRYYYPYYEWWDRKELEEARCYI